VPWSALELVLAVLLVRWFWISLAHEALRVSGFYRWYYGPWLAALVSEHGSRPPLGDAAAILGGTAAAAAEQLYHDTVVRMTLWVNLLAFPFQVLTYPVVFARLSNARPEQLGLTSRRLGRNLLAGALVLLALVPAVFAVHQMVEAAYRHWSPESIQGHPLALLAEQSLTAVEWCLWVLNLVVFAPVVEELTFRGAIQPWLASRPWGGHVGMAGALALSLLSPIPLFVLSLGLGVLAYRTQGWAALAEAAAPALFVLAVAPAYLLVWYRSRSPVWPGIFAASLLFASAHSAVWPTPIPLFVLSLGLGVLAYRTQSLVGPFLMHGLFNGVSCLLLVLK
jgi:membrane protease YdiL (CAAX protease family)